MLINEYNVLSGSSGVRSAGWGIRHYSEPHEGCFHTTAILVFQNNEVVAMSIFQANPVGFELFSYANTLNSFFCFDILFQ